MSADHLKVWYQQTLVAELGRRADETWWLRYSDEWVEAADFPVSPPLPIRVEPHTDEVGRRSVRWFFENLLPEEGVRRQVARRIGIRETDTWALLESLGGEVAGALSVLLGDAPTDAEEAAAPLEAEDLAERIRKCREGSPLLTSGSGARLSLAGAQEKMGVRLEEGDALSEPLGSSATTHILKPENSNPSFAFCPANEWICMQVAGRVGLVVPESRLLRITERESVYVVQRFDRKVAGGQVVRLHQIDLCQVLDLPPDQKYEGDGGPNAPELFAALNQTKIPAIARLACLRWFLFNYLIGNDDAHAKNVSFLFDRGHLKVAPFYDLLCVQAYLPERRPAMSVGGVSEPGQLRREEWLRFADQAALDFRILEEELRRLLGALAGAIDEVLASDVLTAEERAWFRERAWPRIEQRIEFARAALAR